MASPGETGSVTTHIYVHPWADEEEEAQGGGQPYFQTVTLRQAVSGASSPAHGSSPRSAPTRPPGGFIEGFRPIPTRLGSGAGSSLLTAAMRHHQEQQQSSQPPARPNRVIAMRPLEDTYVSQSQPLFIDVTDRGARPVTPHQTVWTGSPAESSGSRDARVHGLASANWLIEEEPSQHQPSPATPKKVVVLPAASVSSNCLAAGLLTIPAVFFHLGFMLGLLLLVVLSISCYFATMAVARYTSKHSAMFGTYGAVAQATSGRALRALLSVATVVSCLTLACIYLAALGDSLVDPVDGILSIVLGHHASCQWYCSRLSIDLAAALVVFPMLKHPNWSGYGTYSLIITVLGAIFLLVLLATAIVALALNRAVQPELIPCHGEYSANRLLDALMAMPYLLCAFLSQQAIVPLMERWKRASALQFSSGSSDQPLFGMNRMVNWSVTGTFIAYAIAALAGCTIMESGPLPNRFSLISSFSVDNFMEQLGDKYVALVANLVLRGTYSLLVLASLPLVAWPMEDHLQEGLDALRRWTSGAQSRAAVESSDLEQRLLHCSADAEGTTPALGLGMPSAEAEPTSSTSRPGAVLFRMPWARVATVSLLLSSTAAMRALNVSAVDPSTQGSAFFVLCSVICAVTVSLVFPALLVLHECRRVDPGPFSRSVSHVSLEGSVRIGGSTHSTGGNHSGHGSRLLRPSSAGVGRSQRPGSAGRGVVAPASAADAEWGWAVGRPSPSLGELSSAVLSSSSARSGRMWRAQMRCTAVLLLALAAFFLFVAVANCFLDLHHPDIPSFSPKYGKRRQCE